jgi:hypothetical protein
MFELITTWAKAPRLLLTTFPCCEWIFWSILGALTPFFRYSKPLGSTRIIWLLYIKINVCTSSTFDVYTARDLTYIRLFECIYIADMLMYIHHARICISKRCSVASVKKDCQSSVWRCLTETSKFESITYIGRQYSAGHEKKKILHLTGIYSAARWHIC